MTDMVAAIAACLFFGIGLTVGFGYAFLGVAGLLAVVAFFDYVGKHGIN